MQEEIKLRIGNLAKAVLVTGQAYQDPKDALNEFVSNAADAYLAADRRGGRITVVLRRQGRHPLIAVDDSGPGMDADQLRRVARSLFESQKEGDPRTLGEKAIGLLAFQQLGGRCDVVTRPEAGDQTHCLHLDRGSTTAKLELTERRRARVAPGTTVYLGDLDPDAVRGITLRKLVDYLQRRRGAAMERGDYSIEVVQGTHSEVVTPFPPDGVRLPIPPRSTLLGRVEFSLQVAPSPDHHRRVAVVGRAGTTIIDDVSDLDDFHGPPWNSDQVAGRITFERLLQTAGRRGILLDREVYPVFRSAVREVEPMVAATLSRLAEETDRDLSDRVSEAVRRIFSRVLRELSDLENPMRSWMGSDEGAGAELQLAADEEGEDPDAGEERWPGSEERPISLEPLTRPNHPPEPPGFPNSGSSAERQRSRRLPTVIPDPAPGANRSRFDPAGGTVLYNQSHPDFLMVRGDETALLDYLSTLVAKEYVLYNHPRAAPEELAEELVRMLVRVRRHLLRSGAVGRRRGTGTGRHRDQGERIRAAEP